MVVTKLSIMNQFEIFKLNRLAIMVSLTIILTSCANQAEKKPENQNTKSESKQTKAVEVEKSKESPGEKTKKIRTPDASVILNNLDEVKPLKNAFAYKPAPETKAQKEANLLIKKAFEEVSKTEYGKALDNSKKAKETAPNYAPVWNLEGSLKFASGNIDEAGMAFYRACELDSNYAAAWVNLSSVYMNQNRLTQAYKVAKHLTNLAPDKASSWAMLGMAYTELEQGELAEKSYKKALSIDPKNSETLYHLAYCYHCQLDYEKAEKFYKESLKINPKNRMGWLYLSLVQVKLNKSKEAIASRKKMEELGPGDIVTLKGGLSGDKTKRLEQFYNNMIKQDPKSPSGYKNLGSLYMIQRKYLKALPLLEKANAYGPDDSQTVILLAQTMIYTDDTANAIKLLESSFNKNKKDYDTALLLGFTLYSQNKYLEAEKYAREAIKLSSNSEQAWCLLCDTLLMQDKHKEEVAAAKHLLGINPRVSSSTWCILVHGLLKQDKFKEASKALQKANLLYPNNYGILKSYGLYYGLQNDIDNAEKFFGKALKIDPQSAKCWYQLASVYEAKEETDKYVNALVKTATANSDTSGINYSELSMKLKAVGKEKEATLALQKSENSTPDNRAWMSLTHTPGQDRHFPVSLRGLD